MSLGEGESKGSGEKARGGGGGGSLYRAACTHDVAMVTVQTSFSDEHSSKREGKKKDAQ